MEFIGFPTNYSNYKFEKPLQLIILASGTGSNFEAIAKAINNNKLSATINCLIVSNPKCGAIEKAKKYSIPVKIYDHRNYISREDFDRSIVEAIDEFEAEIIIMAGWMRVATSNFVDKYKGRMINIHPSLLPSFKGTNSIKQALSFGAKVTGCTVHYVSSEIDSGEIIGQAVVLIDPKDNIQSLQWKIQSQEHLILPFSISIVGETLRKESTRDKKVQ